MSYMIVCDGVITLTAEGAATCTTGWVQQVAPVPFDASGIDPGVAAALFGGGFLIFTVPWAAAWGASQLVRLLR